MRPMVNLGEARGRARRRLPKVVFDVVDGGAGDERTLAANETALAALSLRPRALADVTTRDVSTTVLGDPVTMPVLLSPCGGAKLLHRDGELAVARAAGAVGTVYGLSTVSSYRLEDVAEAASGPLWYQLYPAGSREERGAQLRRAEAAGYRVLCVTIDGAVIGHRERDTRNGVRIPFRPTPRLVAQGFSHPRWTWDFVRSRPGAGVLGRTNAARASTIDETGRAALSTARPVTASVIEELRARWDGPLVVKGVMRGDEVPRLLDLGVDGIVVSNHGGRQLDGVRPSIEILPEVVAAAGGTEVFVDGGFRRGADVVKALALGARAVMIGRPYLFGLAVGGQRGVEEVLRTMFTEFDTAMALMGVSGVDEVTADLVQVPAKR